MTMCDAGYVYIDGTLSPDFCVERRVTQGSVLSPTLFLLVMNLLLMKLQASGLGPSINNLYTGVFLHRDDIRTLSISESVFNAQVNIVHKFAAVNFLKLNCTKCEIVLFSKAPILVNLSDAGIPS